MRVERPHPIGDRASNKVYLLHIQSALWVDIFQTYKKHPTTRFF